MSLKPSVLTTAAALLLATVPVARGAEATPDLRGLLMSTFEARNAEHKGIFHEDVTTLVQSLFPVGQPMAQTRKIIADQKLGTLKPFKGTNDPGMGTMYVTRFDLAGAMFSHVYVVLDFDFDGAPPDPKLKAVKAFLRAANM